jgi:hypothetical protein
MVIKITSIEAKGEEIFVNFRTDYGSGKGIWKGSQLPVLSKTYGVEFDVPCDMALVWHEGIEDGPDCAMIETTDEYQVVLTGLLESIDDDDGYTVIRLGPKIVTCFTDGIPPSIIGNYVTAKFERVGLYPDGLDYRDLDDETWGDAIEWR